MNRILSACILVFLFGMCACNTKPKQQTLTAKFGIGQVKMTYKISRITDRNELTLISRYIIDGKKTGPELNNYFQYQLGSKIRMIVGRDTLKPALSFYVPLISEEVKEIDSKFILSDSDIDKIKEVIISDTIWGLEKIKIAFK